MSSAINKLWFLPRVAYIGVSPLALMVKTEDAGGLLLGGCGEAVGDAEAAQSRRWGSETTVDQALIRGLATAFRVFVSGLSSV
jgi:hypothetical protein